MNDNEALKNVIQQTNDYEKFTFLEGNRSISRKHMERLKDSIARAPALIAAQPILVNDDFEVIDGQHRFTACQELGLPIYYMIVDDLTINDARTMNITHRNWKLDDYARSYAAKPTSNQNYKKFIQLRVDFGLSPTIILHYIHGKVKNGATNAFRRGDLVIDDYAAVVERLDMLAETGKVVEQVADRNYAIALLKIMANENYNQKHMMKKLGLHADSMLKKYAHLPDYLRALEDIYNRGLQEENRIRIW